MWCAMFRPTARPGAAARAAHGRSALSDCPGPEPYATADRAVGFAHAAHAGRAGHAYPAHWEADVVLRDGGTARIRPITTDDAERLVSFYEQVSDESKYYRFFAPYPRLSAKDVHRFTHHDYVDRVGLAVTVGGEFIATVRYDRIDADGLPASAPADEAEVAFLVQDAHQGRGVASALLEHIAAVARERGIRRFAAEVLPANNKMIKVFTGRRIHPEAQLRGRRRPPGPSTSNPPPSPSPCSAPASSAPRRAPCSGCSRRARSPSSAPAATPGGVGRTRPAQPPRRRLHRPPVRGEQRVRRGPGHDRRRPRLPLRRRDRRAGRPRGRRRPAPTGSPRSSPTAASTACRGSSSSPPDTPRAAPKAGNASANWCARPARTACASSARTPSASSTPPPTYG